MPWNTFVESVTDAKKLAQSESFDYLSLIDSRYSVIRRYAPTFLEALEFKAAPATTDLLTAIRLLKTLNHENTRKLPDNAPTGFIRKRWNELVFKGSGTDRRFYELCALSELKNALRSGDIWVQGSRQFKDFDEYLLPKTDFVEQNKKQLLPNLQTDSKLYLKQRSELLDQELATVEKLAKKNALPDIVIIGLTH